jgi:hypothetical protein
LTAQKILFRTIPNKGVYLELFTKLMSTLNHQFGAINQNQHQNKLTFLNQPLLFFEAVITELSGTGGLLCRVACMCLKRARDIFKRNVLIIQTPHHKIKSRSPFFFEMSDAKSERTK